MKITKAADRPSQQPNPDYFTGRVRFDPVATPEPPARHSAIMVTFEPGARTNWHTHPLGQTLHVISGAGLAQTEGGPVRRIAPGDTLWFAPGERHWHGAGPDTAMTHLAIQEAEEGTNADWLGPVTDEEYRVAPEE